MRTWREREWNGRVIQHKTFRSFIETPAIERCGWTYDKVARLLEDTDVLVDFREAMGGGQGARIDLSLNHNVMKLSRETPRGMQFPVFADKLRNSTRK
jgi:hypothetical protein